MAAVRLGKEVAVTLSAGLDAYHQSWGDEYAGGVGTAGTAGSGGGAYETVEEFQLDATKAMVKYD